MFSGIDVIDALARTRARSRRAEDELVSEARRILHNDLFTDKKILSNLREYRDTFDVLDEENLDPSMVFTLAEIKEVAVNYRMKFLDSQLYRQDMPYAALMKIKQLNREHRKELRGFKLLSCPQSFRQGGCDKASLLFARTSYGNYYLLLRWGKKIEASRSLLYWPLRRFENLLMTVLTFTLCLTLSLPTWLITLDAKAEYWSGYRAAAFFHLLIFNLGFTAYITFAFSRNFSSSVWNRKKDFD
jgi:hypothetical protein